MVGDPADDLAQEVFLRLYDRPPRNRETDLGAWLYRVATRIGYNALRSSRRRKKYQEQWQSSTSETGWASEVPDPQETAERRQTQQAVRQMLARLSERQAAILALRYSDLSYREIAEVLQVRAGSVGTLLARAEAAFAREYERATGAGERGANA